MAKGAKSKEMLFAKLKEIYPDAFMDDKVLRIPFDEDGAIVEIKVALTAAKDVLSGGTAVSVVTGPQGGIDFEATDAQNTATVTAPTEEELQNVKNLLDALNF